MSLAESIDATQPGAAGLAYQAADLAVKGLLLSVDGNDIWAHGARNVRAGGLLGIDPADLAFLHRARQLDFYGDATSGGALEEPSDEDCRKAVTIAQRVVAAVRMKLDA
jgi:HEPN domain-containing protein